ncbi:hypothetical protein V3C99_016200 [Haemonchus contortus]
MFQLYRRLKWIYQKFKVSTWLPFVALVSYTVFGAFLFKSFEMDVDQRKRESYRNRTVYAMNQVLDRMLEVRCHDAELRIADREYQLKHAKEALVWFLEHLNLTEVLNERTEDTPWTWLGSMFYAGQLYTTIGYGFPATSTAAGRVASIFYILFGIPIFLIILKDIGRLMSRGCRKLYKRLRSSRRKIADTKSLQTVSHFFSRIYKSNDGNYENGSAQKRDPELGPEQQNKMNARLHAENAFPIPIALSMLFLWILFSASLFCYWEREWGYLTSIYFFFVSISTVGLGDIVFMNPDMMIFNFLLILIGLALLSMCFNLIQAALERLLNRLLEEYIEEIEKMAEIVVQDERMDEEVAPLELCMTGNLLALPMKKVSKETGFLAEAKEWMAGRIANNLLISRLGPSIEESDSEEEKEEEPVKEEDTMHGLKVSTVQQDQLSVASSMTPDTRSSPHPQTRAFKFDRLPHHGRPIFDTVKTLEKIKPYRGDFRSILFSKFLQNERLSKIIEETAPTTKRMVTCECQTDDDPRAVVELEESSNLLSRSKSESLSFDNDSLLSAAFCDLRFDCSSSDLKTISRQESSYSVLKMEDDEPLLPRMLGQPLGIPRRTSQKLAPRNLTSNRLPPSIDKSNKRHPSCSSLREKPDLLSAPDETLERVRSVCGLMPSDFDDHSISSRSDMVDSGYGKSHHEEIPSLLITPSSPYWSKKNTVDEQTGNELRGVLVDSALINQCDSSVKEEPPSSPSSQPPTTTA